MAEFFGFEIKRKTAEKPSELSFVPKTDEDGAGVIQAGGHFGAYLDIDGDKAKSEIDLILNDVGLIFNDVGVILNDVN